MRCFNEKELPGYDPHKKDIFMLEACDSLITNISSPESNSAELAALALKKGFTVINVLKYDGRLTRVELITVSLAAFYRLACAYFCKATALLQISRFAFRKKAAERNSPTLQTNNFLKW